MLSLHNHRELHHHKVFKENVMFYFSFKFPNLYALICKMKVWVINWHRHLHNESLGDQLTQTFAQWKSGWSIDTDICTMKVWVINRHRHLHNEVWVINGHRHLHNEILGDQWTQTFAQWKSGWSIDTNICTMKVWVINGHRYLHKAWVKIIIWKRSLWIRVGY